MPDEVSNNSANRTSVSNDGPCKNRCRGRRDRRFYAVAIGVVLLAGFATRSSLEETLPSLITNYGGDILWALALYLVLGFVFPSARVAVVALLTIVISFGVELSQLYQAPWINTIRDTRIGGLILGFGFKWSDLLCYTIGCLLGIAGEVLMRTIRKNRTH